MLTTAALICGASRSWEDGPTLAMCVYSHIRLLISLLALSALVAEDVSRCHQQADLQVLLRCYAGHSGSWSWYTFLDFKRLPGFRALRSKGDETLFLYLTWILETDIGEIGTLRAGLV